MPFSDLAQKTAECGFDGIEAPVRKGGHIEPEQTPDELPKLVESLRKHGRRVSILTTDINDASDPVSRALLETAAELGIGYYRMKYFRYDPARPIRPQISEWQRKLSDLAWLNKELGITGLYQNHAGRDYFGAAVWDLHVALENIDPAHVGVAYDIRHATVEAGMSWPTGFRLILPHVRAVYVKDFTWGKVGEKRPVNVPLGTGRVSPDFFRMLQKSDFQGPVSLHEEYLDHRDPALVPAHWEAICRDFETLKRWLPDADRP